MLAIEMSAAEASVALVEDGEVREELSWTQDRKNPEVLYERIRTLMSDAGVDWEGLDGFAVGRGPGNYSGLRVAITVSQALALPDGKPVTAVSSGEALAHDLLRKGEADRVAVVGNARREKLWCGWFERTTEGVVCGGDWRLVAPDELPDFLPPETLLAGPEWEAVKKLLAEVDLSGLNVVDHHLFPTAGSVGIRAWERSGQGVASDPVVPIYLHPAVAKAAEVSKKTEV